MLLASVKRTTRHLTVTSGASAFATVAHRLSGLNGIDMLYVSLVLELDRLAGTEVFGLDVDVNEMGLAIGPDAEGEVGAQALQCVATLDEDVLTEASLNDMSQRNVANEPLA